MSQLMRLLAVAGGNATFPAPASPVFQVADSPHGSWSEPQRSKAVFHNGYTYLGWTNGSNGDVEVAAWNNSSVTLSTPYVLHAALGGEGTADMHDNPGLLVRASDHKLIAAYCKHAGTAIRLRISVNSLDSDPTLSGGFTSETTISAASGTFDYPVLLQIPDGTIYLFHRNAISGTFTLAYRTSSDGGATWGSQVNLFRNSGYQPYWQINGDDAGRIDVLTMNANLTEDNNADLLHFYLSGGSRYKSDGTLISASLPLAPADVTVADAGTDGPHQLFCLEYDASGYPIAAVTVWEMPGYVSYRLRRVAWNGSSWDTSDVFTGASPGPDIIDPGVAIDPDDFDRIIAPRYIGSYRELVEYTRSGGVWSGSQLTTSSSVDHLWPIYVRYAGTGLRFVAMKGTYTTYTNYAVGTVGIRS